MGTVREETGAWRVHRTQYKAKSRFGNHSLINLWMDIADIDMDVYLGKVECEVVYLP